MTLRERKKPTFECARAGGALPDSARTGKNGSRSVSGSGKQSVVRINTNTGTGATSTLRAPSGSAGVSILTSGHGETDPRGEVPSNENETAKKKLPRVILHVRPPDAMMS